MVSNIISAATLVFTVETFLAMFAGITIGILLGAIPGLGAPIGMGVLLPFTFTMNPIPAIALLISIYKGSMLGGSFSAILINTPGTASAAATAMDGYPLSKKGQSKKAVQAAIFSSSAADLLSDIFLIVSSIALASFVLSFGSPEMFWILIFALFVTGSLAGSSIWRGLMSVGIGGIIGTVGLDPMSGTPRLDILPMMGRLEGLELVAVLLGAFAISELYTQMTESRKKPVDNYKDESVSKLYGPSLNLTDIKDSLKAFFVGSGVGTSVGVMPGLGSTAGAYLSYGLSKTLYRGKSKSGKFGEGAIPGVVAAESGNSAVSGANMLPLLTLGIPGSAAIALLLGALMMQGIAPGPGIFRDHGDVVFAVFFAMILANVANLIMGNLLLKPVIRVLKSDTRILFPSVMILCFAGVYALNLRMFDIGVMVAIGVLAYIMKQARIPIAPMIIAFILSTQIERTFRTSLSSSGGNFSVLLNSTISKVLIALSLIVVIVLTYQRARKFIIDMKKSRNRL